MTTVTLTLTREADGDWSIDGFDYTCQHGDAGHGFCHSGLHDELGLPYSARFAVLMVSDEYFEGAREVELIEDRGMYGVAFDGDSPDTYAGTSLLTAGGKALASVLPFRRGWVAIDDITEERS